MVSIQKLLSLNGATVRTAAIKHLVESVLTTLPKPYSEDIIDDVFLAIEHRKDWSGEYDGLCAKFGKTVVTGVLALLGSSA